MSEEGRVRTSRSLIFHSFHNLQEYIQPIAFAPKECGIGLGADAYSVA